jgi:hypothetical protein
MKKSILALSIMTALSLTACGESTEEKQARLLKEQQAQIAQLQQNQLQQAQISQQQQPVQPQYAPQPQVIQQPAAAPVIVQAPHQDNTLMNMATGALIGHTIANMGNNNHDSYDRPVERKTVINNYHAAPEPTLPAASVAPTPTAPVAPAAPKTSSMDMNKLSESAKYSPPSSVAPTPVARPSGMNMSALSSSPSRPAVSLSKPSSGMNMSRLSSSGKR